MTREPIFNVHGVVVGLLALLAAVHLARLLIPEDLELWLVLAMAFIPARYSGAAAVLPGGEIASVTSFLTHMFVHGDLTHLAFNSLWMLAFGGAVARRIGGARFLAFVAVTGVAGALTFLAVNPQLLAPVVGASGAVAGLMGGTMRYLFRALDHGGIGGLSGGAPSIPRMTLGETFTDRRVLLSSGIWLLLNALAVAGIGTGAGRSAIAWEAHIGGYLAGLLLFGLFDAPRSEPATADPATAENAAPAIGPDRWVPEGAGKDGGADLAPGSPRAPATSSSADAPSVPDPARQPGDATRPDAGHRSS